MAAQHLIDLGHRSVALLAGPRRTEGQSERLAGMLSAFERAGIEVQPQAISYGEYSVESGRQGTFELLERVKLTALIAANDTLALGALSALQSRGFRVPEQVSLIGFDDIPWAALSYPALTTVHQDIGALARQALEEVLHSQATAGSEQTSRAMIRIPTRLMVRESAGPPPRLPTPPRTSRQERGEK